MHGLGRINHDNKPIKIIGKCLCQTFRKILPAGPNVVVLQYKCWHQSGGFDLVETKTSQVKCLACKATWRTKANYVNDLPRHPECEIIEDDGRERFEELAIDRAELRGDRASIAF